MTDPVRRVVVTGLGTVNCTGLTVEDSWANVLAGNSGIGYFDLYDASALNVRIGGQAWGFDPAKYMDPRDARRRDRFCQMGVAATRQALEDAELHITEDNADDIGCIYGTGTGGMESFVEIVHVFDKEGPRRIHPFAIPMVICDSAASAHGDRLESARSQLCAGVGLRGRRRRDWAGLSSDPPRRCESHRGGRH